MGRRRVSAARRAAVAVAVQSTQNRKLGPIAATYGAQVSCPAGCPFRDSGCYGEHGYVGIVTERLNAAAAKSRATALDVAVAMAAEIDRLVPVTDMRLDVVGDAPDEACAGTVAAAASRYKRRSGGTVAVFKFTHAWATVPRAAWLDVSVLASVERPEQIADAAARGYASALVVADFDSANGTAQRVAAPDGDWLGIPCPAQTRDRQCVTCRLCMDADALLARRAAVLFRAHGSGRPSVVRALL